METVDPRKPDELNRHDVSTIDPTPPRVRLPERIGHYRILERLGEGGMGVVYLAEQERPVRRRVAIKVIKLGMDTRDVVARFEAERQALALMDHPNVARVFDGGATDDGRPYFVMEHVRGVSITAYCDSNRLSVPDRLRLLVQVCSAIQHAHQKGVIHRDIKPGNILVEVMDDKPTPKVIDFGVAKAISQPLTDRTVFTEQGRLIGTPAYMSPEQAEMSGLSVDTRTDIYSLGVVLYELLTGVLPFEKKTLHEAAFSEIQRIIREVEPPRPSTRIGETAPQTGERAERRRSDPKALARDIRGDLDWITMKALEKDPTRRYAGASELGADLERHMRNEPVLAGPPGAAYRLGKFARRHRVGVVAGGMVALALLAGVVGTSWQAARATRAERDATAQRDDAERARDRAQTEAQTARAVSAFLDDMISSADPNSAAGREVTVGEVLNKAAAKVDSSFAGRPLVEASVRTTIGRTFMSLGDFEQAQHQLEQALALTKAAEGEESERALVATAHLGVALMNREKRDEAEPLLRRAFEAQRRTLGEDHPDTLRSRVRVARMCWLRAAFSEADDLLTGPGDAWVRVFGPEALETITWQAHLAAVRVDQGRAAEADKITGPAIDTAIRALGEHHQMTQFLMDARASALYNLDRMAEAESLRRRSLEIKTRVFGADHPDTIRAQNFLAWSLIRLARHAEAESLARDGVERAGRALGEDSPETLHLLNALAVALEGQKKSQEAESTYRSAIAGLERRLGADHPETIDVVHNLGLLIALKAPGLEKVAEGETLLRRALDARRARLGEEHPSTLLSMDAIASLMRNQARFEEAADIFARTLEVRRRTQGVRHSATLYAMSNLASALANCGRAEEAERLERESMEVQTASLGPEHANALAAKTHLSRRLCALSRFDEAESLGTDALAAMRRTLGTDDYRTADCMCALAWTLLERGRLDEAGALANEALSTRRKSEGAQVYVTEPLSILGRIAIEHGDGAGAEPMLREALEQRIKIQAPRYWALAYNRGYLGAAVALQGRFDEAEPLVVGAYETLRAAKGERDLYTRRALADVIALYTAWPRPEEAEKWRGKAASASQ